MTCAAVSFALALTQGQAEKVASDAVEGLLARLEGYSDEEAHRWLVDET
jgi:hypothetical protein